MAEGDPEAQRAAGGHLCLAPPDPSGAPVTQPYPPSPKLIRRTAEISLKQSEERQRRWLENLQAERERTEAHLKSLKQRSSNLSTTVEAMKQQVQDHFESMRVVLANDEKAVLDSLEQERRETSSRLNKVLQDWTQHLNLVHKHISNIQRKQEKTGSKSQQEDFPENLSCHKKMGKAEHAIRLNEDRFQKLLRTLRRISKDLRAELLRKNLLLDSSEVVIDKETCHKQIRVTGKGQGIYISTTENPPVSAPQHPLQFDQVHCALGSVALKSGQHYWEVDVHCCSAWAVGVAYGSLFRKGRDKVCKLGRNRNSWSLEFWDGRLTAWHNDRHVALPGTARQGAPDRVGMFVNYEKGRVAFYNAESMSLLHEFSAVLTSVFDRAHHQFTEPLYPAFRFLRPTTESSFSDHMEVLDPKI